jgi:hypothetical protein
VQVTDQFSNTHETWIYESDTARWIKLNDLNASDVAPLGGRYSEALACILASRVAPEYGVPVPPQVEKSASVGLYALTSRLDSSRCTQYDPGRYM